MVALLLTNNAEGGLRVEETCRDVKVTDANLHAPDSEASGPGGSSANHGIGEDVWNTISSPVVWADLFAGCANLPFPTYNSLLGSSGLDTAQPKTLPGCM